MARLSLRFSVMAENISNQRNVYVTAWDGPTRIVGLFPWHVDITTLSTTTQQASNPPNTLGALLTSSTGEAGWQMFVFRNAGQGEWRSWSSGILAVGIRNNTAGSSHRTLHVLGPGGSYGKTTMWFA